MIKIMCDMEYFDQVREAAEKLGLAEQLQNKLDCLGSYACDEERGEDYTECWLYKDFAPLSFQFQMRKKRGGEYVDWWFGGLVYHGPIDGYGSGSFPTLAVCVTPTNGWCVHS